MFDSPKIYKLQNYFRKLKKREQKLCNKELKQIITSLYYLGKHITVGIKKDLQSMGIYDTSFLIEKAGTSYDEEITFREHEFLLK